MNLLPRWTSGFWGAAGGSRFPRKVLQLTVVSIGMLVRKLRAGMPSWGSSAWVALSLPLAKQFAVNVFFGKGSFPIERSELAPILDLAKGKRVAEQSTGATHSSP